MPYSDINSTGRVNSNDGSERPRSKAVKLDELIGLSDDIEDAPLPTGCRQSGADENNDTGSFDENRNDDAKTGSKRQNNRDKNAAFESAMLILSYGDNSERQLREKLTKRGFGGCLIVDAIERLKKLRYVDDARLMERYVKLLAERKHYGEPRVRMELRRRFDALSIEKYYDRSVVGIDFDECAREELMRGIGRGSGYVARRLAYLGHPAARINKLLRELMK